MKSVVIYDSAFGNTKKIAEIIGKAVNAKVVSVREVQASDLEEFELIIVGSPINAWRPLPSITDFLNSIKKGSLEGIKATTFDTRVKLFIHGDAMNKMANSLKESGADIFIAPEAFYVQGGKEDSLLEGEVEKAQEWAKSIINKLAV
jgi:flavodoxin